MISPYTISMVDSIDIKKKAKQRPTADSEGGVGMNLAGAASHCI